MFGLNSILHVWSVSVSNGNDVMCPTAVHTNSQHSYFPVNMMQTTMTSISTARFKHLLWKSLHMNVILLKISAMSSVSQPRTIWDHLSHLPQNGWHIAKPVNTKKLHHHPLNVFRADEFKGIDKNSSAYKNFWHTSDSFKPVKKMNPFYSKSTCVYTRFTR